jgi:hypothetical protein
MKYDEKKAKAWLESQRCVNIKFEPDGNVPPDFSINPKIGVEVRRLNQYKTVNNKKVPLEVLEFNLIPKIEKLLKQIKKDEFSNSIFLSVIYERPLKVDKILMAEIKSKLLSNIPLLEKDLVLKIRDNLELSLFKSENKFDDYIQLGTYSDRDKGGYIVREIYENLILILKEKEKKVKKYQSKYDSWWLLLLDYIGYELSEMEIQQLNDLPRLTTIFDRIVLISPNNNNKSCDVIINKSYA